MTDPTPNPTAAPAQMTLCLLGEPRIEWNDGRPWHRLVVPDVAWLAILAVDGATARDRLAAMVWPGVSLKTANTNLRQRIFRLRKRTGHPLVRTGAIVALTDDIVVDIGPPWSQSPGQRMTGPVSVLLTGELLAGMTFPEHEALTAWLSVARQRWRARRREHLALSADAAEQAGRLDEAIAITDTQLSEEPLLEFVHRRLIRLHLARGDRAAALTAFERLERLLREELGTQPSSETRALLGDLPDHRRTGDGHALPGDGHASPSASPRSAQPAGDHPTADAGPRGGSHESLEAALHAGDAARIERTARSMLDGSLEDDRRLTALTALARALVDSGRLNDATVHAQHAMSLARRLGHEEHQSEMQALLRRTAGHREGH